jgi:tetratricopeptide (TPR) repeat protein
MAIGRGSVPLEYSVALSDLNEEDILPALDQLIQEGLVVVHGDGYSFVQEGMRTTILDAAKDERRQLLHKRYANMLLESDGLNPERELEAGFHLIDGGETMRGADILARLGPELSKESVTMGEAIPAMETALEKFEQAGRSQADCLTLRAALVFASYFFDYRLAERYGWETIEQLEELAGLNTMERLRPRFGTLLSTAAGLASVGVRNHLGKKRHTALPFFEVITYFVRCISSMIGTCIASLDNEGCKKLVSRLEKLNWLIGPNGYQPVYLMAHAVLLESLGDEAKFVEMANRALKLAEKPFLLGLTDGDRRDLIAGLQHAIGLSECYKIRSTALALADELEKNGGPLATAALLRVRMTYHMLQGDRELTERYRAELETYSIQGGVIWQVEWYGIPIEGAAAVRIADLITLKRVLRDLDRLVQTKPSFSPYRDSTMIGYHMRRGDLEQARKQGERFIAEHPPNSMLGWADAYAAMAMTCNKQRDFDRAYEVCMKAKSAISDADLQYIGIYGFIDIQLALAETGRGNLQRAEELFESSMRVRRSENNPLLMFELAEARVEAAEILGDDEGRANFLAEMYKWSRAAGNPAMLAQCERIAKSAELKPVSSPPEPAPGTQPLPVSDITAIRINTEFNELNDLNDMFAHCEGAKDRALQALRIITQRTASDEGYLYLRKGDNLDLVASLSRGEPPEALEQRVQQLLADSMNTKVSYVEIDSEALPNSLKVQTTKYRIRRMIARNGTNDITLGFVAFSVDSDMDTDIGPSYLRTITEYLRKQGDCVSP